MTKIKEIITSKNTKTFLFASLIAAMILPFSAIGFVEAEQQIDQAEKTSIKNSIEAKMQEQVRKDQDETRQYTSDEYGIPYNLIFENNGKLIIGIDIEKAQEFAEDYSVEEVKSDLQTSQDIEVNYYGFDRESNPVATKVYGGSLIKKSKTLPNMWEDATITLVKNGKIITTGHLATKGTTLYMACGGTNLCTGTVSKNPISSFQGADAALVTTSSQFLKLQENKIKYGSKIYSVTDGVQSDIKKYGAVKMAGTTTPNSSGNILDTDVRVKDFTPNNVVKVLTNQVIANYPSDKGDSGAPVFITTGSSTAKIIGQHVGKFCLVDLNSVATSNKGYGQWCTNTQTGEGALTVFTPWPAVKSNLGI